MAQGEVEQELPALQEEGDYHAVLEALEAWDDGPEWANVHAIGCDSGAEGGGTPCD